MLDSGIAMLYSQPSCYAGQLEASYGTVEANHQAWHAALRDLGLQFRYVTDRMLRQGELDASRYKVLLLSRAEAIGPKEAGVIEAFARNGGTVLADVRPGLYDGHCKPSEKGCLDGLFGVRRTGRGAAGAGQATLSFGGAELALSKALCDPAIGLDGAEAHGRCESLPLLTVRKVDKGQAVLLNFAMTSCPRLDARESPEAAADLLAAIFTSAGVRPEIVTRTNGRRSRNLETVRWRNGDAQIVAFFRQAGEEETVLVDLAGRWYVYGLQGRRSFGPRRFFGTQVVPARPTFVVLARNPFERIRVSLASSEVSAGEVARLRLSAPGSGGLRAVRLRAAEWLHQVVLVGAEPKEVPLPIAFNDPPGKWTVRATDLFTDESEEVTLTVQRGAAR
jgi:hypothetical protein